MKLHLLSLKVGVLFVLVAAGVPIWNIGQAATFSITPAATSNSYTGAITLNIGGLTNGEQVIVQKYLDWNGNGTVDAGEPLIGRFKIADGGASVIGGVTNFNVAFDSNSTTGAIATAFSIAPPRTLENLVGKFVYQVTSPNLNFPATNAAFTVTNSALPQSISGIVYSNGLAPLPNAVVVVLQASTGNGGGRYVAGAVADNIGRYQLNLSPGSYVVMPAMPGYFTDQNLAWQVTLSSGISATNNLFLTNGTVAISGNVRDAGNSNGLAGVLLPVEGGNFFAISFTDASGNYTAGVAPAPSWKIKAEGSQLAQHGYLVPQTDLRVDTTTGSVANVNIALPKATALFYGSFTNATGAPMPNFNVSASDTANQYEGNGVTDANGNYCVAVLGGTNVWRCSPDSSDPNLATYIVSSSSDTNLNVGQAFRQDFVALLATNHISGSVKDNHNNPITNAFVYAFASINGATFNTGANTDPSGAYAFNVANGTWNVGVDCGALASLGLTCLNSVTTNILNANAVVNFVASNLQITTTFLPDATSGVFYSQSFAAGGGQPPYTWSLSPGSLSLPSGLSLTTNGVLSGTPTTSGSVNFSVRVTDNQNSTADQFLGLNINAVPLQITTLSLPSGTNGVSYSQQLNASGGQLPYTWYLPDGSAVLPPGLTLASSGMLSGVPTTNGTFNFQVAVYVNSPYQVVTQALSLTLAPAPLQVTTTSPLPNATQNSFYSVTLQASGGTPPYSWSLAPGSPSLPAGLSLMTNGVFSGTPSVSGGFSFTARVTDSALATQDWLLTLTINAASSYPPVTLTAPTRLSNGQFQFGFNTAYGTNYTILYTTNLSSAWIPVLTIVGSGTPLTVIDPNATGGGNRFYRLKIGP